MSPAENAELISVISLSERQYKSKEPCYPQTKRYELMEFHDEAKNLRDIKLLLSKRRS